MLLYAASENNDTEATVGGVLGILVILSVTVITTLIVIIAIKNRRGIQKYYMLVVTHTELSHSTRFTTDQKGIHVQQIFKPVSMKSMSCPNFQGK